MPVKTVGSPMQFDPPSCSQRARGRRSYAKSGIRVRRTHRHLGASRRHGRQCEPDEWVVRGNQSGLDLLGCRRDPG